MLFKTVDDLKIPCFLAALTTTNNNRISAQVTVDVSTFAVRPVSKQSWRATLSSRAVASGLKRNADGM